MIEKCENDTEMSAGEEESTGLGMVGFPVLCLVIGMVLDEANKRLRFGCVKLPDTVFQFLVGCLLGTLAWTFLNTSWLSQVEKNYTWRHVPAETIMLILLPPLIFESAFKMNSHSFLAHSKLILTVTLITYIFSFAFVGSLMYLQRFNAGWKVSQAFLYAAVISATDPVAVVALLEEIGAPHRLRIMIEGESLFNDGVAVIAFKLCRVALEFELFPEKGFPWKNAVMMLLVPFSAIMGFALARMVIWVSTHGFAAAKQQQVLLIASVWISYYLCELAGSAVLGLVVFGITLNYYREQMNPRTVEASKEVWECFGYWANCVIFLFAGYVVGSELGRNFEENVPEFISGLLLFPIPLLGRILSLLLFFKFWKRYLPDRPIDSADFTLLAWGGLRGALALLLSLDLFHLATCNLYFTRDKAHTNLLYISANVLACLLVQGTSFEKVADSEGANDRSAYRRTAERRLGEHLQSQLKNSVDKLKADEGSYFAGANWTVVTTMTFMALFKRKPTSLQLRAPSPSNITSTVSLLPAISGESMLLSLAEPLSARSSRSMDVLASPSSSWTAVSEESTNCDVRRVYFGMLLARVHELWRNGLLSGKTVQFLVVLLEQAIDDGKLPVLELFARLDKLQTGKAVVRLSHFMSWIRNLLDKCPLLQRGHAAHRLEEARSADWWWVCASAAACVHAILVSTAIFSTGQGKRRLAIFSTFLFATAFLLEQVALCPSVFKNVRKKLDINSATAYMVVSVGAIVSNLTQLGLAIFLLYRKNNRIGLCLVDDQWVVDKLSCLFCRDLLFALVLLRAVVKVGRAGPLLVDLLATSLESAVQKSSRVTLSALHALDRITSEIILSKDLFPTNGTWSVAQAANKELNSHVEGIIRYELREKKELIELFPLIKTRQAMRTLAIQLEQEVTRLAKDGTVPEESREAWEHRVQRARVIAERLCTVPMPTIAEQLETVPWIRQCSDPTQVLEDVAKYLKEMKPVVLGPDEFVMTHGEKMFFLHKGVCRVTEVKTLLNGKKQPHKYYKHPGTWIGERNIIKDVVTVSQKRPRIAYKTTTQCTLIPLSKEKFTALGTDYPEIIANIAMAEQERGLMREMRDRNHEFSHQTEPQFRKSLHDNMKIITHNMELFVPQGKMAFLGDGVQLIGFDPPDAVEVDQNVRGPAKIQVCPAGLALGILVIAPLTSFSFDPRSETPSNRTFKPLPDNSQSTRVEMLYDE